MFAILLWFWCKSIHFEIKHQIFLAKNKNILIFLSKMLVVIAMRIIIQLQIGNLKIDF